MQDARAAQLAALRAQRERAASKMGAGVRRSGAGFGAGPVRSASAVDADDDADDGQLSARPRGTQMPRSAYGGGGMGRAVRCCSWWWWCCCWRRWQSWCWCCC